jgi:ElaA protein
MVTWQCKPFHELRPAELHRVLALRCAVFIVEQNCPYNDPDHKDEHSLHVMGWQADELVAVARIVAPGISYDEVSVGRVATAGSVRRTGLGRELMRKTMEFIRQHFGVVPVRISAQSYLQKFYEDFDFHRTPREEYSEDDIPHVEMLYRPLPTTNPLR